MTTKPMMMTPARDFFGATGVARAGARAAGRGVVAAPAADANDSVGDSAVTGGRGRIVGDVTPRGVTGCSGHNAVAISSIVA
jgi:hypothetical protein